MLNFYGREFPSRLLVGTALYPSPAIMQGAIRASGAQIVTVSLRREAAGGKTGDAFWKLIRELDVTVLPKSRWAETALTNGDEIEIITPRQGGGKRALLANIHPLPAKAGTHNHDRLLLRRTSPGVPS